MGLMILARHAADHHIRTRLQIERRLRGAPGLHAIGPAHMFGPGRDGTVAGFQGGGKISRRFAFFELEKLQLVGLFAAVAQTNCRVTGRQLVRASEPMLPRRECDEGLLRRGGAWCCSAEGRQGQPYPREMESEPVCHPFYMSFTCYDPNQVNRRTGRPIHNFTYTTLQ